MLKLKAVTLCLLVLIVSACSGSFGQEPDSNIDGAQYTEGSITLNLMDSGRVTYCDGTIFQMKTGIWSQQKNEIRFSINRIVQYTDWSKKDSTVSNTTTDQAWRISKSEFGFHRHVPQANGSVVEMVFINQGPPINECEFEIK